MSAIAVLYRVPLLWQGQCLLFPGNAEWMGRLARRGQRNGSWDVMLKHASPYLSKPLDFLQAAHHGSINETPFVDMDGTTAGVLVRALVVAVLGATKPGRNLSRALESGKASARVKTLGNVVVILSVIVWE